MKHMRAEGEPKWELARGSIRPCQAITVASPRPPRHAPLRPQGIWLRLIAFGPHFSTRKWKTIVVHTFLDQNSLDLSC